MTPKEKLVVGGWLGSGSSPNEARPQSSVSMGSARSTRVPGRVESRRGGGVDGAVGSVLDEGEELPALVSN